MSNFELLQFLTAKLYVSSPPYRPVLSPKQYECKSTSIEAFFKSIGESIIHRGLIANHFEERLLMHISLASEYIYIEYPGKESTPEYARQLGKIQNPYDFRPELSLRDGTFIKKLSFKDVAEAFFEYNSRVSKEIMQFLATLLIRSAYMEGYIRDSCPNRCLRITHKKGGAPSIETAEDKILERYALFLPLLVKEELYKWPSIYVPARGGHEMVPISIEGLLYYLDLLAQQEDCKYYYSNKTRGNRSMWATTGRINTLLTMANIINHILQGESYNDIMAFVETLESMVKPLPPSCFRNVTGDIISISQNPYATQRIQINTACCPL